MDPRKISKSGIMYKEYKFNKVDRHLREAGFYCEQLFPSKDFSLVCRQIARDNNPLSENAYKLAILPAKEVIVDSRGPDCFDLSKISNHFVLYMQVEGRLEPSKTEESQLEKSCKNVKREEKRKPWYKRLFTFEETFYEGED